MTQACRASMVSLVAASATACVAPETTAPSPATVARQSRPHGAATTTTSSPTETARATSCPLLPLGGDASDFSKLQFFSKTLFYVRENHPQDVGPRARELLAKALEAVALQAPEVVFERDRDTPPRWVTVAVDGQTCTLNIDRVDAPWSLRSTLQEALHFVQARLALAQSVQSERRFMNMEIAATNGMLSALDRHSRLLDPETYRQVRAYLRPTSGAVGSGQDALRAQDSPNPGATVGKPWVPSFPRAAPGQTTGYMRLAAFLPGVSDAVEQSLVASEGEPPKGIIIDLRDNTGGPLNEAVKVADAFIKDGTLGSIVEKRQRKDLVAHADGHEPSGPLVVLVSRRTAEGAELVAAAIKNLRRGIVLGEPTAGAGAVDRVFEIQGTARRSPPKDRDVVQDILNDVQRPPAGDQPDGDLLGLYLTTGRLLAAGGAEIDGAGVQPDVEVAWPVGENTRRDKDCLIQFAEALIAQTRDPQRSTLLSTAKALPAEPACRSAGLRGL